MKIALLTDGINPYVIGGMQKHSHYLARFLSECGDEVTLVHCVPYGKTKPEEEEVKREMGLPQDSPLRSICLFFPKAGSLPGHYLKESFAYSKAVFDAISGELQSFDLIYAKGFSAWYLLDQKRKGLKTPPVAIKFHGYEMFQKAPSFRVKMEHYLLRGPVKFQHKYCDEVFSYGGKISSLIRSLGVAENRIHEVPTGIAADWISPRVLETGGPMRKFVFVGRYERRKGIEELNEVLNTLLPDSNMEIHFIGPVPPSKKIKSEKVVYHGTVMEKEKIREILDGAEILLTPSHSEGMPNVIMEGMARGLAIIATDVGAVAAQVNAENGWLIEASSVPALEKAMREAMAIEPAHLLKKREASREKINTHFTWEKVIGLTREEFRSIVGAAKA